MRELSLFTGAGGGLLGTKLLGWQHIGYVESDDYRQRVIRQRIDDGYIDNAPMFGDIETFISDGYAASYTGLVDVITAGFPCQPFSCSGKRKGAGDPRNMWPSTAECVNVVRPQFIMLENVPDIIASGYIGTIIADLDSIGYVGRWDCIPASAIGAPHRRARWWCFATYANEKRLEEIPVQTGNREPAPGVFNIWRREPDGMVSLENPDYRVPESGILGTRDGVANWVDRIKATGDGQVPAVVATAWHLLTDGT